MLSLAPDYELMVQLSAPKTTSPFSYRINYADIGQVPVDVSGLIYSTTRRVVLSNQNNGQTRIINSLSIYNADTISNTITIEKNFKGKISLVLSCILNPGDTLLYSDNTNFQVINSDGKLKVTAEVGGGVGIVAQAVTITSGNVVDDLHFVLTKK